MKQSACWSVVVGGTVLLAIACDGSEKSRGAGAGGADAGPVEGSGGARGSGGKGSEADGGSRSSGGARGDGGGPGSGGTASDAGDDASAAGGVAGDASADAGDAGANGGAGGSGGAGALGIAPLGKLVAGVKHTCAIKADATVACWGYNSSAQIGTSNFTSWDRPFDVPGLTDMIAVAAGDRATCAVKRDGTVHCWGDSVPSPPVAMDFTGITARSVAMGSNHKCLVTTGDDIYCWGSGSVGQLGDGLSTAYSETLVRPMYAPNNEVLTGVVEASLGLNHTCALRDDGKVACWGDNDLDAIANGGNGSAFARNVPGITTAVSLASGPYNTCVALADGTVQCWGAFTGTSSGTAAPSPVPVPVPGLSDIVRVAAGEGGTCALRRDRRLLCWGYEGTVDASYTPRLEQIANVTAVAVGGHTCALLASGGIECWGPNQNGQLGVGHMNSINSGPNPGVTTVLGGNVFWVAP